MEKVVDSTDEEAKADKEDKASKEFTIEDSKVEGDKEDKVNDKEDEGVRAGPVAVVLCIIIAFLGLFLYLTVTDSKSVKAENNVMVKFLEAGNIDDYIALLPKDKYEILAWGKGDKVTPREAEMRLFKIRGREFYLTTFGGKQYLFNSSLAEVKPHKKAQFWGVANNTKAKKRLFYVDIDAKPELIDINRVSTLKLLADGDPPGKSFDEAVDKFIKSLDGLYLPKQKKSK